MGVEVVIETITQNLGIAYEDLVLLMTLLGSLIIFAKDFRIGFIFISTVTAGLTIIFYELGMSYVKSLIVMLTSFVLMSLSLYISYAKESRWIV